MLHFLTFVVCSWFTFSVPREWVLGRILSSLLIRPRPAPLEWPTAILKTIHACGYRVRFACGASVSWGGGGLVFSFGVSRFTPVVDFTTSSTLLLSIGLSFVICFGSPSTRLTILEIRRSSSASIDRFGSEVTLANSCVCVDASWVSVEASLVLGLAPPKDCPEELVSVEAPDFAFVLSLVLSLGIAHLYMIIWFHI